MTAAFAGFWRRLSALVVDAGTLLVIDGVIRLAIGSTAGRPTALVFAFAYFTILVGARGQTLGMRVRKIRVVSTTGGTIGYTRAFIRWIAGYLSAVVLLLGFLWMLWDDEKQCWHDKLASDFVVIDVHPA